MRAVFVSLALAIGASQTAVPPAPDKIPPWTTALLRQQPEDAFLAVYELDRNELIHVGAKHSTDTRSLTFAIIEGVHAGFDIDTVFVEGMEYARGPNPERFMAWIASRETVDNFQENGEIVPTVRGAARSGATVWGGGKVYRV